jgi:predicted glutamine amidotransferase
MLYGNLCAQANRYVNDYEQATRESFIRILETSVQEQLQWLLEDEEPFLRLHIKKKKGDTFFDDFDKNLKVTFQQVLEICGSKAYVRLVACALDDPTALKKADILTQHVLAHATTNYKAPWVAVFDFKNAVDAIVKEKAAAMVASV